MTLTPSAGVTSLRASTSFQTRDVFFNNHQLQTSFRNARILRAGLSKHSITPSTVDIPRTEWPALIRLQRELQALADNAGTMAFTFRLIFRIFYTSLFTILFIVLVALLTITPADAIRQALQNEQPYNVFVIAGCYFITILTAMVIFAARLYTNKQVLAAIPKTWIPVEKGDVNKKVRKMIVASLNRSAAIAWDSRPRIPSEPPTVVSDPDHRDSIAVATPKDPKGNKKLNKRRSEMEKDEHTVTIPPHDPVWGEILHDGWSPPTSPDLPNLQYTTVILELPHLIEARAVSLAPPDPESDSQLPLPDMRAVDVLQRPASMGLREYVGHLTNIGTVTLPAIAMEFLAMYEFARFSGRPLSEPQFRALMRQFAELLRCMGSLSPEVLESLEIKIMESDIEDDASSSASPLTHRSHSVVSRRSANSHANSEGTVRTSPSRNPGVDSTPTRNREFSTAPATPATPQSRRRGIARVPSANSFAQSRRPYNTSSGSSGSSLRSVSQGSVIKLSRSNESHELPYVLTIPGAR